VSTVSQVSQVSRKTIKSMSQEEAISELKRLSQLAKDQNDLSLVFGNNGRQGRMATGNYTLIAKCLGRVRVHVGRALQGKAKFGIDTLRDLSLITGVSIDDIVKYIEGFKKAA
jgi:hypothetical protein